MDKRYSINDKIINGFFVDDVFIYQTSKNKINYALNDKIFPITSNIFALKAGTASDTQFLIQTTKNYMSQFAVEYGDVPPVKVAARILQQFQYEYKNYFFHISPLFVF